MKFSNPRQIIKEIPLSDKDFAFLESNIPFSMRLDNFLMHFMHLPVLPNMLAFPLSNQPDPPLWNATRLRFDDDGGKNVSRITNFTSVSGSKQDPQKILSLTWFGRTGYHTRRRMMLMMLFGRFFHRADSRRLVKGGHNDVKKWLVQDFFYS